VLDGFTITGGTGNEDLYSKKETIAMTAVAALDALADSLDVATLLGEPAVAKNLVTAGVADADVVITATDVDEVNLLCASTASYLGADRTFAMVTHSTYLNRDILDYSKIFSIDSLICPSFSTARAIASHLRNPAALKVERLVGHTIELQQFEATKGAAGVGRHLSDVKLPGGARLAAITRDGVTYLPSGLSTVDIGDEVLLVANTDVFHDARRVFRTKDSGRRSVVIMGGSPVAVWLCRALENRGFSIRLFETDSERANELAEKLSWVTVIQADPTDPSVFTDEHIENADAFVALTNDEHNILSCAWAVGLGVAETYPVVSRKDYAPFVKAMGLTHTFSPSELAVAEIQKRLKRNQLTKIATLPGDEMAIYRVRVGKGAPVIGKPLSELQLMPDCMVIVLEHDEHTGVVPSASEVLEERDIVFVVVRQEFVDTLRTLFAVT
jgi:trk system potassium uptake protein TrkA